MSRGKLVGWIVVEQKIRPIDTATYIYMVCIVYTAYGRLVALTLPARQSFERFNRCEISEVFEVVIKQAQCGHTPPFRSWCVRSLTRSFITFHVYMFSLILLSCLDCLVSRG